MSPPLHIRFGRFAAILTGCVVISGCATTSQVLNPAANHTDRAREFRNVLQTGNELALQGTVTRLDRLAAGRDRMLYLKERGRLQSLAGDIEAGIRDFQEASDAFEAKRMRPSLSASQTFFSSMALATNDLAIRYDGAAYEKVMLHNLQALNYLKQGDFERARIELNRADVEQEYAREQNRLLVEQTRRRTAEHDLPSDAVDRALNRAEQRMGAPPGSSATAPFLNAFTYYLSGLLFMHFGEWDRAVIDLRKARDIEPGNSFVRDSLQRAVRHQEGRAEVGGESRVIILYGDGFIAGRSALQVPFVYGSSVLQIALPYHDRTNMRPPERLRVSSDSGEAAETQVIADLNAQAVYELREQYAAILVRQVLRLVVKRRIQQEAEAESPLLGLIANIFNVVTDRPDLRSWQTLPANLQIASLHLPPGAHELNYGTKSGTDESVRIDLAANETVFLIIDRTGNKFYTAVAQPLSTP